MEDINEALKNLLLKIITTISSTKFWLTILGMAASGYLAYQTGGINAVIIAVAGIIGLPIVYTVEKTRQNVELAKADVQRMALRREEKPKDTEDMWQIDLSNFHRDVENTVTGAYGVNNPSTIYFNAERLGHAQEAGTWENAQDYWNYLTGLSKDSYKYVHGETVEDCKQAIVDKKGTCTGWDLASHTRTKSMADYYALLKLERTEANYLNTLKLKGKCDYSLYFAGEMARYL